MKLTAKYATSFEDAQAMRRVRNTCVEFLTRDQRVITYNEQRLWFKLLDRSKVWPFTFSERGKVVGYGLIRLDKGALWLSGGLLPASRGKGLGRELFSFLVGYSLGIRTGKKPPKCKFCDGDGYFYKSGNDHMRNDKVACTQCPGPLAIRLEVFVTNYTAYKLYRKLGFKTMHNRPMIVGASNVDTMEFTCSKG